MQQPVEQEPKNKFQMPIIVISKWFWLAIPILIAGFWLVLHPEFILNNINQPYALLAGPALIASVLLGWLIVTFFKTIVAWCKQFWNAVNQARKDDGAGAFFWLTIYIMMAASVLDSGPFYDQILPSVPFLGYVIALVFDMVAVNGMRARLEAKRMRDTEKGWLYLLAIIASTCSSIYANLYMSLEHAKKLPEWMTTTSPWMVILFPTMIIVMSLLADHLLEKTSTRLDVAQFAAREAKKLAMMQARLDSEEARKKIDDRMEIVRGKGKVIKIERDIFYKRWFMPARYPEIEKIVEQVSALYEPQIKALNEQIEALNLAMIEGQSPINLPSNLGSISVQSLPNLPQDLSSISDQSLVNLMGDQGVISRQSSGDLLEDYTPISTQSPARLTINLQSISAQTQRETDPDLNSISRKITGQSQGDLPQNSVKKQSRITRDLSKIEVPSTHENQGKEGVESGNKYAITKKEAALLKRCSVKEIEQGTADGTIREYGNNKEKVLVSSLKNFVPSSKRKLKIVNS